ncbi:Photosystem II CP47 chlorophyll apoprotein [Acorus gramineus]|uniref:Photosystem II CP47 chlorophyll apoprotein n=1 Tax=Acorus gramineus TaxID=55184 RepID=A0AAV9B7D4_ACOGR|nr:Photosystem II CP47 chlorophyll apoprotein [Acorus gramineus]
MPDQGYFQQEIYRRVGAGLAKNLSLSEAPSGPPSHQRMLPSPLVQPCRVPCPGTIPCHAPYFHAPCRTTPLPYRAPCGAAPCLCTPSARAPVRIALPAQCPLRRAPLSHPLLHHALVAPQPCLCAHSPFTPLCIVCSCPVAHL